MIKRIILLFFILCANANAQSTCIVYGQIVDSDAVGKDGSRIIVTKVSLDSTLISQGRKVYISGAGAWAKGWFYIPIIRSTASLEATANIEAQILGFTKHGGTTIAIPNQDSLDLATAVSIGLVPTVGMSLQSNDVAVSGGKVGTLDFGSDFTLTISPAGEGNIDYTRTINPDDYADFATAVAAANSGSIKVIEVTTAQSIDEDLTVNTGVKLIIQPGGVITRAPGDTLSILGLLEAGPYQIYAGTGGTKYGMGTTTHIYPEWEGDVDGTADQIQINLGINALKASALSVNPSVLITGEEYEIMDDIVSMDGLFIKGKGMPKLKLGDSTGDVHILSAADSSMIYEGLVFDGNGDGTNNSTFSTIFVSGKHIVFRDNVFMNSKKVMLSLSVLSGAQNIKILNNRFFHSGTGNTIECQGYTEEDSAHIDARFEIAGNYMLLTDVTEAAIEVDGKISIVNIHDNEIYSNTPDSASASLIESDDLGRHVSIQNNYLENTAPYGNYAGIIAARADSGNVVTGNKIKGTGIGIVITAGRVDSATIHVRDEDSKYTNVNFNHIYNVGGHGISIVGGDDVADGISIIGNKIIEVGQDNAGGSASGIRVDAINSLIAFNYVKTTNDSMDFGIDLIQNTSIGNKIVANIVQGTYNNQDIAIYNANNSWFGNTGNVVATMAGIDNRFIGDMVFGTSAVETFQIFDNGHLKSTQATAPTATLTSTTLNDGGGSGAAIAITAGSTDASGSFTVTAGNGTPTAGIAGQLVFNTAYTSIPKAVLFSSKDSDGTDNQIYYNSVGTASFQINFNSTLSSSEAVEFSYWVIQ